MLRRMEIPKMVFTQEPLSKVEIKKNPSKTSRNFLKRWRRLTPGMKQ